MATADTLFEVLGTPVVRIDLWSHKLNMWVYLVPRRTGQNPPGTLELMLEEVSTLQQWIAVGWPLDQAIQQLFGITVTLR